VDDKKDCVVTCVQFEKIFEPYTKYCLEQEMCREYIKTNMRENELFRTFIAVSQLLSTLLPMSIIGKLIFLLTDYS